MTTEQLNDMIGRVRQHARWVWWATTILGAAGVVVLGLLAALGLDSFLILPPAIRLILLVGVGGGLAWFFQRCWRIRPSKSLEEIALLIEKRYPELDNVLINSLQLAQHNPRGSETIVAAVTDSAGKAIRAVRSKSAVQKRFLAWAAASALIGLVVLAGLVKFNTTSLTKRLNRVLLPFADNTLTRIIDVKPGDANVLMHSDTTITATIGGRVPSQGRLVCTLADNRQITIPMYAQSKDLPDRLTATVEGLEQSLRYRVLTGDDRSQYYELRAHRRPRVQKIIQTIRPPNYIEADSAEQFGGTVRALTGSNVKLQVHFTQALGQGTLVFDDGHEQQLRLKTRASNTTERRASFGYAEFVVERAGRYKLDITSAHGFAGEGQTYDIIQLRDHPPQVRFIQPTAETTAEIDAKLTVEIQADDDFAVRELKLLQILSETYVTDPSTQGSKELKSWKLDDHRQRRVIRQITLSMAELGLSAELPITLQAFAYDHRPGAEPGVSELIVIRKTQATAELLERAKQMEKVSLAALIAKQRANIAAGEAMLEKQATGDIAGQIELQEEIRAEALSIAGIDEQGQDGNLFIKRKLTNLAQTLMVLAIEQLRKVPGSASPAVSLGQALETEREIVKTLVLADIQQDQELAQAQQRHIAELLAELTAKQKTLLKDTIKGTDSGKALSRRQRALARDLASLQSQIDTQSASGAGGDPGLTQTYARAATILAERAVRANMLIAAEDLVEDATEQAIVKQEEVIADLTEIQKLLQHLALNKGEQQVQQLSDALADFEKRLKKMADIQQAIVEIAKQLQKTKDLTEGAPEPVEHLQEITEARRNIAETIEQLVKDMHLLPDMSASNDLLAEMSEIYEDVKQVPGSEEDPVSEIAVDRDEGVLESLRAMQEKMGERLAELETWLMDRPDSIKWNQESFDKDELGKIPLGDLPDALEDIVGELLEQSQALADQAQDSASNVGFPDTVLGWDIMDGPMPSWAAKGKSGNMRPNTNEQVGRSGSGRQGASSGEIVGDTIKALEGSEVQTRRTSDAFQAGELKEEKPGFMDAKATGGGKLAGTTDSEGMQGSAPSINELKYRRLARRAEQIHRNAETVYSKASLLRLPTGNLDSALLEMNAGRRRLASGDLEGFTRNQHRVIHSLKWTHGRLTGKAVLQDQVSQRDPNEITGATKEPIPEEYEDMVGEYMRQIARD